MKREKLLRLPQLLLPYASIDLGTVNTLICVRGRGIVLDEPSVIAVNARNENEVLAVGREALRLVDSAPGRIRMRYPMREGVVADREVCAAMLRMYLERIWGRAALMGMRLMLCLPMCVSEVERRALQAAARDAGVRDAMVMEEPIAAALGAHLPIYEARGSMIVDVGGGTTDVAVLSLGGIAVSASIRSAGTHMDEAIVQYVEKTYGMCISRRTAEQAKIRLGSLRNEPCAPMRLRGRSRRDGMPCEQTLCVEEVSTVLRACCDTIFKAVREVLAQTPPELAGDVMEHGIMLCGGGAQLRAFDAALEQETGIPVFRAENPMRCVAVGALRAMAVARQMEVLQPAYGSVEMR